MGSLDVPMGSSAAPHDDYGDEDFHRQLLDMLGSPRGFHHAGSNGLNGLNALLSPEINSSYDWVAHNGTSLGSPDFTRQLNSAGLHDFSIANNGRQPSLLLPPLQLGPSAAQPWGAAPAGWTTDAWLPQSPTCPTLSLSPLPAAFDGGGGFQVGQLLASQEAELHAPPCLQVQPPPSTLHDKVTAESAAVLAATYPYAPITPHQQQQLPQLAPAQQQQQQQQQQQGPAVVQPAAPQPPLQQLRVQHKPPVQQRQHRQRQQPGHLPPGLWLVAPFAHEALPVVVQHSPTVAAAAAANNAVMRQQQVPHPQQQQQQQQRQLVPRKRQLGQQPAQAGGRKAARAGSSTSPSAASVGAAVGTGAQAGQGSSIASPTTPTSPPAAGVTAEGGAGLLATGSLVWGKVNRFPWWPAVVIPPSADDEPASTEAAAAPAAAAGKQPPVFVRFLGTHDTAWLEPGKVSAWPVQLSDRSSKTKAAAFVNALREGRTYAATGVLPGVFRDVLPGAVQEAGDSAQEHSAEISGPAADHHQQQLRRKQGLPAASSDSSHSRAGTPGTSSGHGAPAAEAPTGAIEQQQDEVGPRQRMRPQAAHAAPKLRPAPQPAAARVSTRSVAGSEDVRHTRSGRQLKGS